MGLSGSILPDADRGMPRWGVAPIHGQGTRIGIGVPLAVVQPQARKRHGAAAACPIAGAISCPATPKVPWALVDRHRAHRFGIRANAFRAAEQGAGPAEPRLAEQPRRRDVSNAQIVQSIIEKGIE